jgi:hypothetical protein
VAKVKKKKKKIYKNWLFYLQQTPGDKKSSIFNVFFFFNFLDKIKLALSGNREWLDIVLVALLVAPLHGLPGEEWDTGS